MKFSKVLRRTSLLVMACASLAFISCGPKPGEEEVPEPNDTSKTEYTLSVSEDTVSFDEGDDAKTITVTTNGTVEVEVENETFATASVSDNIVTITPKAAGSTTVIVSCKEDSTKTVDIVVTVNALVEITLNLDSALHNSANSITVKYGADNGTYNTVNATYAAGEESATVCLKPSLANAWYWYNNIIIKVYNSTDEEIPVMYKDNFCYKDTTSIAVAKKPAKRTFTIIADGFNFGDITGLKYTTERNIWTNGQNVNGKVAKVTDVTVSINAEKTEATFTVDSSKLNESGWFQVNFADAVVTDDKTINDFAVSSGNTNTNEFYYSQKNLTHTLKYVEGTTLKVKDSASVALTGDGDKTMDRILEASELVSYSNISSVKVEIKFSDNAQWPGENSWACLATDVWLGNFVWKEGSLSITDTEHVDSIIEKGLSVYGNIPDTTASITITIVYKPAN